MGSPESLAVIRIRNLEGDEVGEEEQDNAKKTYALAGDGSVPNGDGEAVVGDEGEGDENEGHAQKPETSGNEQRHAEENQ